MKMFYHRFFSHEYFQPLTFPKLWYLEKAATVKQICADTKGYDTGNEESEEELPLMRPLSYSNECICWQKQKLRK